MRLRMRRLLRTDAGVVARLPIAECRPLHIAPTGVRAHVHAAQFLDEIGGVVAAVGTEGDRARPVGDLLYHVERRQPLGVARARVSRASTISPERFSISPWPMKQSLASMPGPLRGRAARRGRWCFGAFRSRSLLAAEISRRIPPRPPSIEGLQQPSPAAISPAAPTAAPCPNTAPRVARQRRQGGVRDLANHPQRMIRPNPILNVYVAEKAAANLVVTTHRHPHPRPQRITERQISNYFSNSLLGVYRGRQNSPLPILEDIGVRSVFDIGEFQHQRRRFLGTRRCGHAAQHQQHCPSLRVVCAKHNDRVLANLPVNDRIFWFVILRR